MENRLIFLLAMPNLFLMLERCFSIVVGEVFKRLATSLLVRPFFIILQISISLEVNLALLSASLVPNEDVSSSRFFRSSCAYLRDSLVSLSFCIMGNSRHSALAITLSSICLFSISTCPRTSTRAIFFCSKDSFCFCSALYLSRVISIALRQLSP